MTDTITIPREELQAALDALTNSSPNGHSVQETRDKAIQALRARLAQQQNEEECRKTCTALCAGTGDTGGDWPCVKQRGNHD